MLIFEALQPAPRYVVLASRRGLIRLWFSRKPFSHVLVLAARIQWTPEGAQEIDSEMSVNTLSPRFCSEVGATPKRAADDAQISCE